MTTPASRLSASPLQIERHEFLRIELQAAEDADTDLPLPLQFSRDWAASTDDPRKWRLVLSVDFGAGEGSPSRYSGSLQIAGYFQIAKAYPEEKMSDLIGVTGASILYGACREMLANLTARSVHGMVSLPSISFLSSPKEIQEKATAEPIEKAVKIETRRPTKSKGTQTK